MRSQRNAPPIALKWNQDWRLNQIAGGKKLHVVLGAQLIAPNLRLVAKSLKIKVKGFSEEKHYVQTGVFISRGKTRDDWQS